MTLLMTHPWLASLDSRRWATLVSLSVILTAGVFCRVYNLEPVGWVPDHYERLTEVERMLDGRLPASAIYPPGFSLVLLIPLAILGATVQAMQVVTVVAGLAVLPLVYALCLDRTQDWRIASLAAMLCAISPFLVYSSRFGFLDSVITPLILMTYLWTPRLSRDAAIPGVILGLLLALLVLLRPVNGLFIPILVAVWTIERGVPLNFKQIIEELASPLWMISGVVCTVAVLGAALPSFWFGSGFGGFVTLADIPRNLWIYALMLAGHIATPFILPLALYGAVEAYRSNRRFAASLFLLLIVWPVIHSPVPFATARYMDIGYVFVYILVAFGAVTLIREMREATRTFRALRAWGFLSVAVILVLFGIGSGFLASEWTRISDESDYGLSREAARRMKDLPQESLVITSTSRAFERDGLPLEFVDLIDLSIGTPDRSQGSDEVRRIARAALADGHAVYYLSSHLESDPDRIGGAFSSHEQYLDGISAEFRLVSQWMTAAKREGKTEWTLFKVEAR